MNASRPFPRKGAANRPRCCRFGARSGGDPASHARSRIKGMSNLAGSIRFCSMRPEGRPPSVGVHAWLFGGYGRRHSSSGVAGRCGIGSSGTPTAWRLLADRDRSALPPGLEGHGRSAGPGSLSRGDPMPGRATRGGDRRSSTMFGDRIGSRSSIRDRLRGCRLGGVLGWGPRDRCRCASGLLAGRRIDDRDSGVGARSDVSP